MAYISPVSLFCPNESFSNLRRKRLSIFKCISNLGIEIKDCEFMLSISSISRNYLEMGLVPAGLEELRKISEPQEGMFSYDN